MTDNKQITKRQHYVSQFYLKKFANSTGKIHVYDFEKNKILKDESTKKICQEDFYFGYETGKYDEASQKIEKLLEPLESSISNNFNSIITEIENPSIKISDDSRDIIALLMSMFYLNSPKMRNLSKNVMINIIRQLYGLDFIRNEVLETVSKEEHHKTNILMDAIQDENKVNIKVNNYSHFKMMEQLKKVKMLFLSKKWIFHIIKNNKNNFITSNVPVTDISNELSRKYGDNFFIREHYFALTPNIMLESRCKINSKKKIKRNNIFSDNTKLVWKLNCNIINANPQYIYANSKDTINFVSRNINLTKTGKLIGLVKT